MADMPDDRLIGYCEMHCQTERALFSGKHINRILALTGHPEGYVHSVAEDEFISVHGEMEHLCKLARDRMAANRPAAQGAGDQVQSATPAKQQAEGGAA